MEPNPDSGCTAAPTALQHNDPWLCATDTQMFTEPG